MIIYPTVLYIKEHSVTGMQYFGKTTKEDPYQYLGSGKRWLRHIKKHGTEHVKNSWVSEPYIDSEEITQFALAFSADQNIVESKAWANLIAENGLDGVCAGTIFTDEHKAKISAARLGKPRKPFTDEHKAKLSAAKLGKTHTAEAKANISAAQLGKPLSAEHKAKISAGKLGKPGKPHTDKVKAKMSAARLGKTRGPYKPRYS